MKSTTSTAIIKIFNEIFALFGSFKTLVTDNGTQFISAEFENFLANNAVKHLTIAPYHPSSNGEGERMVQTLKRSLKKLVQDNHPIDEALLLFLTEYRSAKHKTTGESPAILFLRRPIRSPYELIRMAQNGEKQKLAKGTPQSHNHNPDIPFSEGDTVWGRINIGRKDLPNWAPGIIKKLLGNRMAEVELDNGPPKTLHIDQIRPRRAENNRQRRPKIIFDL